MAKPRFGYDSNQVGVNSIGTSYNKHKKKKGSGVYTGRRRAKGSGVHKGRRRQQGNGLIEDLKRVRIGSAVGKKVRKNIGYHQPTTMDIKCPRRQQSRRPAEISRMINFLHNQAGRARKILRKK